MAGSALERRLESFHRELPAGLKLFAPPYAIGIPAAIPIGYIADNRITRKPRLIGSLPPHQNGA